MAEMIDIKCTISVSVEDARGWLEEYDEEFLATDPTDYEICKQYVRGQLISNSDWDNVKTVLQFHKRGQVK